MPNHVPIEDPQDPQIAIYMGLRDHAQRQLLERPGGPLADTFIAEGDIVIQRGLAAGIALRSVMVDARRAKPLPELPPATTVYDASEAVLTAVTGRPQLRDPLACFVRSPLPSPGSLLGSATRVAVLVGINNPNNLGVIMRNAAGLGVEAVLLDATCGDPLYRRAIRASMGQVFVVPYARAGTASEAINRLHDATFETIALTPRGNIDLRDVPQTEKSAVILGAEGPGLPDGVIASATHQVRIAMARGVDSLNVANAAAIAFHHLQR